MGRAVAYGYRYGEVELPKLPNTKPNTKFMTNGKIKRDITRRAAVATSLGCHVEGACLPHPDPTDPDTTWAGVIKRFASQTPVADSARVGRLRAFVRSWLKKNLEPLKPDTDISVPTWLEHASYPQWRKEELAECHANTEGDVWSNPKLRKCKSFMKDEFYAEFKHARAINARTDQFKCVVGPIFHQIEKKVFQHPAFIKKVPVHERPAYIYDRVYRVGGTYVATDYTSFEALFTRQLMMAVEIELYAYMTSSLPFHPEFMRICDEILAGRNTCKFRDFSVDIDATRMSGEMCTSLGNGFSNLMFMEFLCDEVGATHAIGVVEGDDGLYRVEGPCPTVEDFASLGLVIKLDHHDQLETASFCGLVFDLEDQINVTDPIQALMKFGWTSGSYSVAGEKKLLVLLRAKAMSLKHQFNGCPILDELANYALRITAHVPRRSVLKQIESQVKNVDSGWWDRQKMEQAILFSLPSRPVGDRTRLLVERLYHVPVELQHAIEAYLRSLTVNQPLDMGIFLGSVKRDWESYWNAYVLRPAADEVLKTRLDRGPYSNHVKEFDSWKE